MTIQALNTCEDIQFNNKFFNDESVNRLLEMDIQTPVFAARQTPSRNVVTKMPKTMGTQSLFQAPETKKAIAEAMDWLREDPEYAKQLAEMDEAKLQNEVFQSMEKSLTATSIKSELIQNNRNTINKIRRKTDANGIYSITIGEEELFRVNTRSSRGVTMKKVLAAAFVLLDVIAIISDIIGIGLHYENKTAKRVADWLKKIQGTIVGWGQAMWRSLKSIVPNMKQAKDSPKWLKTIKQYAARLAQAIFDGLAWAWENKKTLGHIKDAFMYGFKAMFAKSVAKCIYYSAKLIATIVIAACSAGANIYIMIVELIVDLCSLAEDLLDFIAVMSPSDNRKTLAA